MSIPTAQYSIDPPAQKIITQNITSFTITSVYLNPFNSAVVNVRMFDENNICLAANSFLMEGDDYTKWNDDDNYLIEYVTQKIRALPALN